MIFVLKVIPHEFFKALDGNYFEILEWYVSRWCGFRLKASAKLFVTARRSKPSLITIFVAVEKFDGLPELEFAVARVNEGLSEQNFEENVAF